nr:GspH/FimT family pseudopilin [Pseudoalteromonas denitrificans]
MIELMVSCSIVSIILAISSPSFTKLLATGERDNRLFLLKSHLMYSRIFAINNNTNVTVCPLDSGECSDLWHKEISIFVDYDKNQKLNGEDYLLKIIGKINKNHTFTYPRNAITYKPDGSISGFQSGSFIYCLPEYLTLEGKRITMSQAGRIKLQSTNKC